VLFRFAASTSNEHNFQNTCPNGVIQNLGESSKSLVSSKASCSSKSPAFWKFHPGKGNDISADSRLHLLGTCLLVNLQPRIGPPTLLLDPPYTPKGFHKVDLIVQKVHLIVEKMDLQNRALKWLFWAGWIAWFQGLNWMGKWSPNDLKFALLES